MSPKKRKKIKNLFNKKKILSEFIVALIFLIIIFLIVFIFISGKSEKEVGNNALSFLGTQDGKIESSNEEIDSDLIPPLGPILYLGSFGYTSANIDKAASDLYFDNVASAVYFRPNIVSENLDISGPENLSNFSFADEKKGKACIGNNCLSFENDEVFYKDRVIALPKDIAAAASAGKLAGVSIAALDSQFLIGFTLARESDFLGKLYSYRAGVFREISLPQEASSEELALFGFGGITDDYIVVYGAKLAKAWHFKKGKTEDISRFFGLRTMLGGFKPEIIRAENSAGPNWYVFSGTRGKIIFIKLWQNAGDSIVASAVLTDLIPLRENSAIFSLLETNDSAISFAVLEESLAGLKTWRKISDRGFLPSSGFLQSLAMSVYNDKKVNLKNIVRSNLNVDKKYAASAEYFFSTDGLNFQTLPSGNNLEFSIPLIEKYWLRAKLPQAEKVFESPYISSIAFDYAYERMD